MWQIDRELELYEKRKLIPAVRGGLDKESQPNVGPRILSYFLDNIFPKVVKPHILVPNLPTFLPVRVVA